MVQTRAMKARLEAEEARNQLSKSKPCWYFDGGSGYCRHEDQCHYSHACEEGIKEPIQEKCNICYDAPQSYGLLENCAHVFCLECISKWRKHSIYEVEDENTNNQRLCPVCRRVSRIVLPLNYLPTDAHKDGLMQIKRNQCAAKPCKYFSNFLPGKTFTGDPLLFYCPYFNDCLYAHIYDDKPFTFDAAMIARQKEWLESQYDDLWEYMSEPESMLWTDDGMSDNEIDSPMPDEDGAAERNPIEIDSDSEEVHQAIRDSLVTLAEAEARMTEDGACA